MKLSIITINYNNSEGLERTIKSIINQSFSDFEYLVIDGASNDDSVDIIKKYSDKISYWISEKDTGVYNAMNKGIKQAQGEYLLFINSGDTLYTASVLAKVFSLKPQQDLVYGDLHRIFPDGHEDIAPMPNNISVIHMLQATLTHPTTFIKRELFTKYGLYREDLKITSDWAFFLKLIAFGDVSQQHIPLTISTFGMDGISTVNEGIVSRERYEIIKESFSPELNHMCFTYNFYENFYNKPIFVFVRKAINYTKLLLTPQGWKRWIYLNKINSLIWLFNKDVRKQKRNLLEIPLIIINYNRLDDLKFIINFYSERGHRNIVIVDNKSSYAPLLSYYDQIKSSVTIEYMDRNYGHRVFWENKKLYNKYAKGYYIITDPDIIPNKNLPQDYLKVLMRLLDKNKKITKVGFALDITDIPDYYGAKIQVLAWENKFWENKLIEDIYMADIDTTFALYRPYYMFNINNFTKGIRVAGSLLAKHTGWYIDPQKLSEEDTFYMSFSNSSNSWKFDNEGQFKGSSVYK